MTDYELGLDGAVEVLSKLKGIVIRRTNSTSTSTEWNEAKQKLLLAGAIRLTGIWINKNILHDAYCNQD